MSKLRITFDIEAQDAGQVQAQIAQAGGQFIALGVVHDEIPARQPQKRKAVNSKIVKQVKRGKKASRTKGLSTILKDFMSKHEGQLTTSQICTHAASKGFDTKRVGNPLSYLVKQGLVKKIAPRTYQWVGAN